MVQLFKKEKTLHSPNLNTVIMVEETLREVGELVSLADLKRRLPRKVATKQTPSSNISAKRAAN